MQAADELRSLRFHSKSVQAGDTILTMKISDPIFSLAKYGEVLYTYVSINLTDKAIVKMVFGSRYEDKKDFDEVVYRKIKGRYYPSYIRSIFGYEFDKRTKNHYNSCCILFYELLSDKQSIKVNKGNKVGRERNLRSLNMKLDEDFWKQYPYKNQLSASSVLQSKFL